MSRGPCEVFLGTQIDDRNEARFLRRVRADLERHGGTARIYANFITRRSQRQVDFLISTAHRLVHVELKAVDPGLPLIGSANGPWEQQLPDGQRRSLERNFYRQAQQTTFAISDDMHDLANRGEVPQPGGKFYRHIHTVICLYPDIPADTRVDHYNHVDVLGYRHLLMLLSTDGPHPAWADDHWSTFTRHLQMYPQPVDGAEGAEQRISRTMLEDYRRRFVAARRRLRAYVPIAARRGETIVPDPAAFLTEATASGQTVVIVGKSGTGKSHAAQHAAVAVAENGGVPVWVRCGEYERGRLSHALSRAVAPFTTQACLPLLHSAVDLGCPVLVILDGVNECVPTDREVLIEQVGALQLRVPVAVVITSTEKVGLPESNALTLQTLAPDDDARTALMAVHGHRGELSGLEAFQTPMELSMAAECGESLRPGATSTELFDAYVTRLCPSETTRAGLRRIATEMDIQLRGSLTTTEVRLLLHRATPDPRTIDMDTMLGSPLLAPTQGRIAFSHELLARFLTAEQLVLEAADSRTLAEALGDVRRTDLHNHAVALEADIERRLTLLLTLSSVSLLRAAARGAFGPATAHAVIAEVSTVLEVATAAIDDYRLTSIEETSDNVLEPHWTADTARNDLQQALLCVAGRCLADGLFIEESASLLDATDRRCTDEMRRLREAGSRRAISAVVQATYGRFVYGDDRERRQPAASVVVRASEHGWIKENRPSRTPSAMRRLWDYPGQPRWGRLTAALLLMNPDDPADLRLLPDVFAAAWKANGYHLRLTALDAAMRASYNADESTRQRMRSLLDDCDKDNVLLNSLLFEALAAHGGLDPLKTEDEIRAEIAEILASPADPQAWDAAQAMIGMTFEDQRLHGPYAEVLYGLEDADALRLHVMAARSSSFPYNRDTILKVIVDHADRNDDDARAALRDAIGRLDWDNPFRDEAIRAHLIAIYGWAKLTDRLPPPPADDTDPVTRTWRIVDELLFEAFRGTDKNAEALAMLWSELLGPYAANAVDAVAHVRSACRFSLIPLEPSPYVCLVETWPDQTRQLFEWCLLHYVRAGPPFDRRTAHDARRELIADLAYVGTHATIVLLEPYLTDPEIGATVVDVIRAIKRRLESTSRTGAAELPGRTND
ncbi:NERD domain-containing protein [Micromonospora sp. CA-263727]|uniref:NERD domain-containing protein n=1 Tax=Micromonospora sp. CA-263727 TaxID=3239967 RepID=UPI003D8FB73B